MVNIKVKIKTALNRFAGLLYPSGLTCVNCGREIKSGETRYNFCAECTVKLPTVDGHRCKICGAPLSGEEDYCDNCTRYDRYFDSERAPLVYDGEGKELIKKLKFGNKRYVAEELAKMMSDEFIKEEVGADVITAVPMTDKEIRERGFNQSYLLAEGVAKRLRLNFCRTLVKTKETDRQKMLTAKERRKNLKGVFAVSDKSPIKGKSVLLIDDVFTTGATVNECAAVLKKAGAVKVYALTACISVFKPEGERADG